MIVKFWKTAGVVAIALLTTPAVMFPQTKDQLIAIQRDVAQLQDQIRQLQKAQSEQIAGLTALVQQAVDESKKTSAMAGGMQRSIDQKLTDMQTRLVAPVATLGSKVDQMTEDFRSVGTNVGELTRSLRKMDDKLNDISQAVRSINAAPVAPPTTNPTAPPGPACPASSEVLFNDAFKDYSSRKDKLALDEFAEFLRCFNKSERAPEAQYYIGNLYDRANQFDDAAQAFDAVLTRFPENPKTPEAMYMKGVMLQKGGHKTDAGAVYREFIEKYPASSQVARAKEHLKGMGLSVPGARPPATKKNKK